MTGPRIVVTGTDTGIGKTVFAAALTHALGASYWKPVQSGLEEETDSDCVARLAGLSPDRILPSAYRLALPASPHRAAAAEGVEIDPGRLVPPDGPGALVVEGAGGLMVPLTRRFLFIDLFARWGLPVVLCARTALGTINHTLLSVEALARRGIPLAGIAFIGEDEPDTVSVIAEISGARVLGRLPRLASLDQASLAEAFAQNFSIADFQV